MPNPYELDSILREKYPDGKIWVSPGDRYVDYGLHGIIPELVTKEMICFSCKKDMGIHHISRGLIIMDFKFECDECYKIFVEAMRG